jgi:hypothetical protein
MPTSRRNALSNWVASPFFRLEDLGASATQKISIRSSSHADGRHAPYRSTIHEWHDRSYGLATRSDSGVCSKQQPRLMLPCNRRLGRGDRIDDVVAINYTGLRG